MPCNIMAAKKRSLQRPFEVIIKRVSEGTASIIHRTVAEIGERTRSKTLVAAVLVHKTLLYMFCEAFPSIAERVRETHMFGGSSKYFAAYDYTGLDKDIDRRPWVMAVYCTGETITFECETIGGCKYCVRILTKMLFKTDDLDDLLECIDTEAMTALVAVFLPFACTDGTGDITLEKAK